MRARDSLRLVAAVGACTAVAVLFAVPALLPAGDAKPPATASSPAAKPGGKPSPPKTSAKAEPVEPADNSYCLVCHLNYENEKLAHKHQVAGVGCTKCHGESEKHSGDEDGLTAPDIIYAHEDVNKFCMTCHPQDKIAKNKNHADVFPAKVADKTDKHTGKSAGPSKAEEQLVCTECHGEKHRMEVRTRKWDKKTRKLISDDGVRMMYKNSPATEGVKSSKKKP
jgi:hypothetical protein